MGIKWRDQSPPIELSPLPDGLIAAEPATAALLVDPEPLRAVWDHLRAHPYEQGGLLLGRAYAAPADPHAVALVHVMRAVAAVQAQGSAFALRMESRLWTDAQAALQSDWRIVGWYHSHPGLSAFFSDTDRRTQQAFFAHRYSIGWVIDPHDGHEAVFLGPDCTAIRRLSA